MTTKSGNIEQQDNKEYLIAVAEAIINDIPRLKVMHDLTTEPMIGEHLFNSVLKKHLENPGKPIKLVDIGSGPSHSSISLIEKVNVYNAEHPEDTPINLEVTALDREKTVEVYNNLDQLVPNEKQGLIESVPSLSNLNFVGHNVADYKNPLPVEEVDFITANNIVIHMPKGEIVEIIQNWTKALAPGGEIVIVSTAPDQPTEYIQDPVIQQFMAMVAGALEGAAKENPEKIEEALKGASLEDTRTEPKTFLAGGETPEGHALLKSFIDALVHAKQGVIAYLRDKFKDSPETGEQMIARVTGLMDASAAKVEGENRVPEGTATYIAVYGKKPL